jgi:non-specific serine/threonine protein kinase
LVSVQQVGAAVVNGRIWVAGGLTSAFQDTAKTEVYDPTIDAWQPGPSLPYRVHHAMMVAYQNQPVVIGGFTAQPNDALATTSARVLILKGNRWVDLPNGALLNRPRGAGAAVGIGNKIIVVGGRTGHPAQLVTPTEIYDGTGWYDADDIPVPGDHLAAATDGTYLYAVGGRKFVASANTPALQRFDPNTRHWTALTNMPEALSGAGAAVVGGRLIVVGGEGTTSAFADVYAYDLTTTTWTTRLPDLPQGRHGLAVAAIGTTLYAIDGATQPGHFGSTNTVEALIFS